MKEIPRSFDFYSKKIKSFKSRDNDDAESFIGQKPEVSCRMKQAVVYLLCDDEKYEIVACFMRTFKVMDIPLAGGNFIFLECEKENGSLLQTYDKIYCCKIVPECLSKEGKTLFRLNKIMLL